MTSATSHEIPAPSQSHDAAAMQSRWPLYLIEGALLAAFMISACAFTALLEHPASLVRAMVPTDLLRRAIIGLAMGATAVSLIYSRWGRRSGAHMNPAVTLCFLRMGKIGRWDAVGYVAGQFAGGVTGVLIAASLANSFVGHPSVQYVVTMPGSFGVAGAWAAEFIISAILMGVVLGINQVPRVARFGGFFAGSLVAIYIALESPISGMSMNPARSVGSAAVAHIWQHLWIYFTAPPMGMLAAVELHRWFVRHPHKLCPRMNHCHRTPSIFHCNCHASAGIEAA